MKNKISYRIVNLKIIRNIRYVPIGNLKIISKISKTLKYNLFDENK